METIIRNKLVKITGNKPGISKAERIVAAATAQKRIPGKSLEQIRIEAVRQLREMGILI